MKRLLASLLLLTLCGAASAQTSAAEEDNAIGSPRSRPSRWRHRWTSALSGSRHRGSKIIYDTKGSTSTRFRFEVRDRVLTITERPDSRRTERTQVTVCYNTLERIAVADAVARFDSTLRATVLDRLDRR